MNAIVSDVRRLFFVRTSLKRTDFFKTYYSRGAEFIIQNEEIVLTGLSHQESLPETEKPQHGLKIDHPVLGFLRAFHRVRR